MTATETALRQKLTPETTLVLDRYLSVLPSNERLALTAWLSTFYPYQLAWLLETQDHAINVSSRQIGKSHTTGACGVLWGAIHGELTTIISIGDRESGEVLRKCFGHAEFLQRFGSKIAAVRSSSKTEIAFASGGRVLSLPSSAGRGFTGNVFLDEFAYQQHADDVWDNAAAVTTLGGRIRIASTPNGTQNNFCKFVRAAIPWRDVKRPSDDWALHSTTIDEAIAQGFPAKLSKLWAKVHGDERIFGQLYRCKFLDGELQYIPTRLIKAATVDEDAIYCPEGQTWAGLDIGRDNDLTALVIIRQDPETRVNYLWHVETCKRTSETDIERLAALAINHFGVSGLYVDSTGLGTFPTDNLARKYGPRVHAYQFTQQSKEVLATTLYCVFADERLRMAEREDPGGKLRNDVAAIQRIVTDANGVKYDAPRTADGHADRAWALALALHGCNGPDRQRHEVPGP